MYLAEVVLALEDLHNYGITHRDIKPQNLVIDKKGHIKITDYGLSEAGLVKRKQDEQKNKTLSKFILKEMKKKKLEAPSDEERIVGSPYYMAPEVLLGGKSTPMSDWWSFGILAYHTLLGVPPFTGNNLDEIKEKVLKLQTWPSCVKFGHSEETISYEAKDLIDKLLMIDPMRRLGVDMVDIKEHSFFHGIDWEHLRDTEPPICFDTDDKSYDDEGYLTEEDIKGSVCGSANQGIKLIRRDILKSQTQENHLRGQKKYNKLLSYAETLQKTCRIG
jgi:serine/threonine protein kinase